MMLTLIFSDFSKSTMKSIVSVKDLMVQKVSLLSINKDYYEKDIFDLHYANIRLQQKY